MILDNLPTWNLKLGAAIAPAGKLIDIGLIAVAIVCIVALFKWKNENLFKAILLAYIISP